VAIATSAAPAAALSAAATGGLSTAAGLAIFAGAIVAMLAIANNVKAFAHGGVFTNSVVSSPTTFPIGLMGESGPEAILPLKKTSSGVLGVVSQGGGNNITFSPIVQITIENTGNVDPEETGRETAKELEVVLKNMMTEFVRKQQLPGGQLNRQSTF